MKALRAAGTESATITLNKVYEILGETRDEALDEEEEGEPNWSKKAKMRSWD